MSISVWPIIWFSTVSRTGTWRGLRSCWSSGWSPAGPRPARFRAGTLGQRPLRGFVAGAVLIAIAGIAIDQSLLYHLDVAAGMLRYYWYRLSDAMLPAGAALALVAWLIGLRVRRPAWGQAALIVAVLVVGGNLALTNYQRRVDLRPGADVQMLPAWTNDPDRTRRTYDDWRRTCQWIAEHTPPTLALSRPRCSRPSSGMPSGARCAAGRTCRKTQPNWSSGGSGSGICIRAVSRSEDLAAHGEQRLRELAAKYGADFVVVDRSINPRPLLLPRLYPPGFCRRDERVRGLPSAAGALGSVIGALTDAESRSRFRSSG